MWVDPKIYNSENQKYLSVLKEFIEIDSMTTAEAACQKMAKGPINEKYQLICAASLKDEEYLILQNDNKC